MAAEGVWASEQVSLEFGGLHIWMFLTTTTAAAARTMVCRIERGVGGRAKRAAAGLGDELTLWLMNQSISPSTFQLFRQAFSNYILIMGQVGIFIDPAELPKGGDGACQLIFLLLVYG